MEGYMGQGLPHLQALQAVNTTHFPGGLKGPEDGGGYGSRFMAKIWASFHGKGM